MLLSRISKPSFSPIETYKSSSAAVLENPVISAFAKPLRTAWNYAAVATGYVK